MNTNTTTREKSTLQSVMEKPLYPEAKRRISRYLEEFVNILTLQAKLLAYKSKADIVLSSHIDDAFNDISNTKRTKTRELSLIFGSALLGAFLQGFVTEISYDEIRITWIVIYVAMGFLGMIGIFWGLLSK